LLCDCAALHLHLQERKARGCRARPVQRIQGTECMLTTDAIRVSCPSLQHTMLKASSITRM
jgi:hypothetical protein